MANYTKSFNFRNGVQVDDSNFVVNSVGLVGIGTTTPDEHLDVRGNIKVVGDARITGYTSVTNIEVVGVMTVGAGITLDPGSGIITATKFIGDASGLANIVAIATDGFIANVGSLTTTAKIGIGNLSPTNQLDVSGDSKFVGVTTFSGITTVTDGTLFANSLSVKTLAVEGVSTFTGLADFNGGVTVNDIQINVSSPNEIDTSSGNLTIDSATGQTIVDDNLNVTGIVSAADYKGLSNGAADFPSGLTATTASFSNDVTFVGVSTDIFFDSSGNALAFKDDAVARFGDGNDLNIFHNGLDSYIAHTGIGSLVVRANSFNVRNLLNNEDYITVEQNGGVKLFHNDVSKFETISVGASVYNELRVASLNGGTSGLSPHFGSLRYGNEQANNNHPYSTRGSLDLINTDRGNINFYLNAESLANSFGDFFWHRGFNSARLMTLTGDTGRLGIGQTLPTHKLHVVGNANITAGADFGGNVDIQGDLSVSGTFNSNIVGNVTGNLTGHVLSAGISTFSDGLLVSGVTTSTSFKSDKIGVNVNVGSNPVEINSGTNRVFVTASGSLGIRTDETFGNSLFNTGASVSNVVGVGTTLTRSAVDFADAGKNIPSGSLANKMFMLPPKITTAQRGSLTGVSNGALIYNTDGDQLQVYINGWVGIGTTTKVDS